jgi:DNA-directed RNA polymerase specialized sigma24 family protein
MKYFEDLQNKEIAEILETTANNVNVALHSARTKLKTRLTPYVETI